MKKLLSALTATALTATVATSVVSCGIKPEKNVVFALPEETIGATSNDKQSGYKDLVAAFNDEHAAEIANGEMVEIETRLEKSGNIAKNIAAKNNLPDLYVIYADAVSTFQHSGAGSSVRDMSESMGNGLTNLKESLITKSFINEGTYNGKQLVLPYGKSVDLSVINVRLLTELTKGFVSDAQAKTIKEKFEAYNQKSRSSLFATDDEATMSTYTSINPEAFEKVKKNNDTDITSALQTFKDIISELTVTGNGNENPTSPTADDSGKEFANKIRTIFKKTENIEAIVTLTTYLYNEYSAILYSGVYNQGSEGTVDTDLAGKEKASNHYAFSIDSMENKYFMDHVANTDGAKKNIDIADKNNGFMYNAQLNQNESGKVTGTTVELNTQSESYKHTTKLFNMFQSVAKKRSGFTSDQQSIDKSWKGTFMTKYNGTSGSVYTSTAFQNGTTLVGSGSSAGAYNYTTNAAAKLIKDADLLTTSTINNEKDAFMSQGPGLAGFKSTGTNAVEKEKTVTAFLQYMMQPKQAADFALKTNYMPSTTKAMKIYQNYVDGTYNNSEAFAFDKVVVDYPTAIDKLDWNNIDLVNGFTKDVVKANKELMKSAKFLEGAFYREKIGTVKGSTTGVYVNLWQPAETTVSLSMAKAELTLPETENAKMAKKYAAANLAKRDELNKITDEIDGVRTEEQTNTRRFEKYFTKISDYIDPTVASSRANVSSINSGYINDYLFDESRKVNTNTLLVTSTPSPIGTDFRDVIKSAIVESKTGSIMYTWNLTFNNLLENATKPANLKTYLQAKSGDDVLKKVTVSFK